MCREASTACACAVLETRPQGLSPAGLADLLRRIARLSARADACRAEVIAEAERTGAAREGGYGSTTAWLSAVSGEPAPVCRSQIAVASALEEMPETKAAFAAGEVSESRVRVLAQAQALAPEPFARDEASLVAQVASASSQQVPRVLAGWKRTTDLEGAEAEVERLHAQRALHVSPAWSGMVHLTGDLDPESGSVVLAALGSLAEAANLDAQDTRTPAQCRADALVEICRRHLNGKGPNGTARPHLTVTVPWETLRQGHGVVDTDTGPISAGAARRLACDATVLAIVVDGLEPMAAGRSRRVVSPALRRALEVRDGHCTYPGCDTPAWWCDAHHLQHWAEGGTTDLANLRLLCRRHHRDAHHHQPYPQRR